MRVKEDGTAERVSVVSGSIVDETVVVVGDLKKGDIVQLYASTSSESSDEDQSSTFSIPTGGGTGGEMPSGG